MPVPTLPVDPIPSEDPKNKKSEEEKKEDTKLKGKGKENANDKEGEEELSEEDMQLRNELEMLSERLKEPDTTLYKPALETLRTLIRTSTSSMTSVPKPLKFLRPHYPGLQQLYETWPDSEDKSLFAEILSVLAMTYSDTEPRGSLKYRILSGTKSDPGLWGHEYVRHLAAELGSEYTLRQEAAMERDAELGESEVKDLRDLARQCATFFLGHNAEADAVDLLEELENIDMLKDLVDKETYSRVCLYMVSCVNFLPPPDDIAFLQVAHDLYLQNSKYPEALALAIRLFDPKLIADDFHAAGNPLMKKQLAFILARAQIPLSWLDGSFLNDGVATHELPEEILECLSNSNLSNYFRDFGKELGVQAPKTLEEIYKSHLETTRGGGVNANVDSARANLAGTFVNAFVNAGFGNDKLMVEAEEGNSWVYKNKDHGMLSASASLGLSLLWDHEMGLQHVDKYTYSSEEYIKAGAFLATGMLNCGIRNESDAAKALLEEHVENKSVTLKTMAIVGLGIAYVGSHRADLLELLLPILQDDGLSIEVQALAALSLGFIFVGSANGDIAGVILQLLMEKEEADLSSKWTKFVAVGLALLYVGRQEASDATIEILKVNPHPVAKQARILVDVCSYAGTSNVLKVQEMLHHCNDHVKNKDGSENEELKKDSTVQSLAVLGIALVAMGEDVGAEMSLRTFNHLMHYGDPAIRKMVPIALGLVSSSNPQLPIMDTLSKYSHDNDLSVAINAIFAMGLIGAGTSNARLAQMLRQLAGYYHKEADCLFMVRVAQGMVHMGKGTVGLNPFFSDRGVMSLPAVAGLLTTLVAFTDASNLILDKQHWMLYFLTTAMYPRFMITLDEELKAKPITVRVGQAVDIVGQAGKPRRISGFQTHQTPVRLGTTERAELGTEEFVPFASVLEGIVILQKNPGWEEGDKMEL